MFAVWFLQFPVSLKAASPVLLKVHDVNGVDGETDAGEEVAENSEDQSFSDDGDDDEGKAVLEESQVDEDGGKDEYDNATELAADLKSAEQEYQEDQAEKKRKHASGEDVEEATEKFEHDKEDAKQSAGQEVEAEAEQEDSTANPADIAKAEKAAVAEVVADHAVTLAADKDDAKGDAESAMMPKFDFDSLAATLQGKDDVAPTKTAAVLKVNIAAKPVSAVKAKVVTKPMTGVKAKAHSKLKSVAKAKKGATVNAVVKPVTLAKANKVAAKVKVAVKPNNKKKAAAFMHVKHSEDVETDGEQADEATVATDTATSDAADDGVSADEDSEPALLQTVNVDADDIESDEEETDTDDDDSEDEASNNDANSEIEKQDAAIEAANDNPDNVDIDEMTGNSAEESSEDSTQEDE